MEKPAILFLQETKCSSEEMEKSSRRIRKGAQVAAIAGGIGFLWNPNLVSISNICATHFIISVQFHILGSETKGVVSNVYGSFQPNKKYTFLKEISSLREWVGQGHWIIGRDFNLI